MDAAADEAAVEPRPNPNAADDAAAESAPVFAAALLPAANSIALMGFALRNNAAARLLGLGFALLPILDPLPRPCARLVGRASMGVDGGSIS